MRKIFTLLAICVCVISSAQSFENGKNPTARKKIKTNAHAKMPQVDAAEEKYKDSINEVDKVGPKRFAKKFVVNYNADNSGELYQNANGTKEWELKIQSDNAYSVNIYFSTFKLNEGDTVYVYNKQMSKIIGPLTQKDNLKSGAMPLPPIDGDNIIINYRMSTSSDASNLVLGEVNHDYTNFRVQPLNLSDTGDNCSYHTACQSELSNVKQAVCLLILNGTDLCTGTLINNTSNDRKPYLLTAAHCLVGSNGGDFTEAQTSVSRTVVFFNFEAPNCNTSIKGSTEFYQSGGTLRAMATDIDFALLELNSLPANDYRTYLAGWERSVTPTAPFRGVHHPYGTIKRMARDNNSITNYTESGMLTDSHWKVGNWEIGTTQIGSSGSPLFDSNFRIVGALTGGYSQCGNNNFDFYYRFNKAWNYYPSDSLKNLRFWLDPNTTNATNCNGLNPYADTAAVRESNVGSSETIVKKYISNGGSGLISGQNSLNVSEYAEQFSTSENAYLYGVYLVNTKGNNDTSSVTNEINIRVYVGDSLPEYLIAQKVVKMKTLIWNNDFLYSTKNSLVKNENYIRFDQRIPVGKNFFIAYTVPYANLPADSFAVYTIANRNNGINTAFAKKDGIWRSFPDLYNDTTSLWIDPIIQLDTAAASPVDTNLVKRNTKNSVVFPNPATDKIRILLRKDVEGKCIVDIYDVMGRYMLTNQAFVLDLPVDINISSYPQGVYFLRIKYENDIELHKIIKNE